MTWLESRLETDIELGYPNEPIKWRGKKYYLVTMSDDSQILIQDRGPMKHDYSISMYLSPDKRELIEPKTRQEYKEAAKNKKWKFSRAVIAADSIEKLPNIEEIVLGKDIEVIETKKEIQEKKEALNANINRISKDQEVIEEYIEEEKSKAPKKAKQSPKEDTDDEFITIPGEIQIRPRKKRKDNINPVITVMGEDKEDVEDVEDSTPIPADLLAEEAMVMKQLEENKAMEEAMPPIPSAFKSFEIMYEELASNAFNPAGVLNKDPQSGKYLELDWMSKHFSAKGESGKSNQLRQIAEKFG